MKMLTTLCMLVAFAAWPLAAHSQAAYTSDELKFEILFPSKPKVQTNTRTFASGDARMTRYKSIGERIRPSMTVTVYSHRPFTSQEIARGLDLSYRGQVEAMNGEVVAQKDLMVNGVAGKETIIKGKRDGRTLFYRVQTFYAGNRQYILSVLALKLEDVMMPADSYFASFKPWE